AGEKWPSNRRSSNLRNRSYVWVSGGTQPQGGSDARLWTTLSPLGAQAPAAFCVQAATNAHAFLITLYDNGFTRSEISGAFRAENCEQNLQDAAYRRDGRCVGAGPGRLRQYGMGFSVSPEHTAGQLDHCRTGRAAGAGHDTRTSAFPDGHVNPAGHLPQRPLGLSLLQQAGLRRA